MTYILRYTNRHGEKYFFVSLGEKWPHRPEFRLISETTADITKATRFDTMPAALLVLLTAGDAPDWEVIPA